MPQISLSQGLFATVDDDDFEYLNQWKWSAARASNRIYAIRHDGKFPFRKTVRMHRVIMNTPDGMQTDHKDGDGLNNTRANLRVCTSLENARNSRKRFDNASGYKGVVWSERHKKWRAEIRVNYKAVFLGYFSNVKDAAHAYDEAAQKYYGEYARTNA